MCERDIIMKIKDFLRLHSMFPVVVLFSVAVSGTSYYLNQHAIAFIEFGLGILLSVLVFFAEMKNFSDLKKTVDILNSHIVERNDDRLSGIPLPFVICSPDGGIVWYNDLFEKEIIADKELSAKQVRSFVPAEKLNNGERSFNANYNGKRFTVYVSKITDDHAGDYVLFFIDDTYYKDIADHYKESRPVVMIASVDALDEVSSMVSHNQYSTLLSDTERMIISWFTHYMCILRKTGDGRFFITAEYKVFEEMKKENFSILENVRDYRIPGVNTGFTLSVGIATGNDLFTCESIARKAHDMAKGRGGDQVVINDNNEYEFFGGVAAGVESRNQVQSRVVASSVEELIKNSSNVLIMGHKNSDLDALGASVGLAEAAMHLDRDVKVVIDEKSTMAKPLLNHYRENNHVDLFVSPMKAMTLLDDSTLVVVADVMRPGFAESTEIVQKAKRIVVIDHHRMSVDHISDSMIFYHEPNTSSTGEMVTELIRYMPSKPKISKEAAEGLLSGIYLDTKNFTLKTGVRTFEAAAYLKDCGADTITVRKLFAATAEENSIISSIVNSAQIKGGFAYAKTYSKDQAVRLAAAKAADDLLNIEDVDASFVIFPTNDGGASVSARSYGRVNVQIIMEKLGGGGHQTMAAAQLQDISVDSAEKLIEETVSQFSKKNSLKTNKKEE